MKYRVLTGPDFDTASGPFVRVTPVLFKHLLPRQRFAAHRASGA